LAPAFSLTPKARLANVGGSLTFVTVTENNAEAHKTGAPLSHTVNKNVSGTPFITSKLKVRAVTIRAQPTAAPVPIVKFVVVFREYLAKQQSNPRVEMSGQ
jgi:hypothetical protein